jgi:hypothetical protein
MSPEARYQRLLRLYPRAYRDEHGPEILTTLMESAGSSRRHPEWRETAELVVGALRARAGRVTPASALRLAALLLLAHATAILGAHAGRALFSEVLQGAGLALPSSAGYIAGFVAGASALVLVAAGRYRLAALLTVAALVSQQWANNWIIWEAQLVLGEFWQLPLALLTATALIPLRPAPCRRPWLWTAAVPMALVLLPTAFDASLGLQPFALLAVGLGCLAWSVVDARAGIAGGALMLGPLLSLSGFYWVPGWANGRTENLAWLLSYGLSAALLLGVGLLLVRRQARL